MKSYVYRDNTGGTNFKASNAKINTTTERTEYRLILNLRNYQEGGFERQEGNTQLNTGISDATEVLSIGQYTDGNDIYIIYTKASGNAYVLALGGGAEGSAIKGSLNASAKSVFAELNGSVIVVNGADAMWKYNTSGGASNISTPPTAWTTTKPHLVSAFQGERVFAIAGSTLYWCDQGDEDTWTTANDSGSVTDAYGDASSFTAMAPYGDRLALYKKNRVYTVTGTDFDNYAIVPLVSNRSATGKYAVATIDDTQWFYTGTGIIPLITTELGVVKLGPRGSDISRSIRPFFAYANESLPILPHMASSNEDVIMLPYFDRNELIVYCKTASADYYDTAAIFSFDHLGWVFRQASNITAAANVGGKIITGTSDGRILQEFSGATLYDDSALTPRLLSGPIDFGGPHRMDEITHAYFWFETADDLDVTVNWYTDYRQSTDDAPNELETTGNTDAAAYGVGAYGSDPYSATAVKLSRYDPSVIGRAVQFDLTSQGEQEDFRLTHYVLDVEQKDGN